MLMMAIVLAELRVTVHVVADLGIYLVVVAPFENYGVLNTTSSPSFIVRKYRNLSSLCVAKDQNLDPLIVHM